MGNKNELQSAAALLGAKGGSVTSEAKKAAARANAKKPRRKKPLDQLGPRQRARRLQEEAAKPEPVRSSEDDPNAREGLPMVPWNPYKS